MDNQVILYLFMFYALACSHDVLARCEHARSLLVITEDWRTTNLLKSLTQLSLPSQYNQSLYNPILCQIINSYNPVSTPVIINPHFPHFVRRFFFYLLVSIYLAFCWYSQIWQIFFTLSTIFPITWMESSVWVFETFNMLIYYTCSL